jgi:archaeal flagellar protein FlaJ
MSKAFLPLAPFPITRTTRRLIHGFCPIGAAIKPAFPRLEHELEEAGNTFTATEYLAGMVLTSVFYFAIAFILILLVAGRYSPEGASERIPAVAFAGVAAIAVFGYSMLFPRLLVSRSSHNIDRNLLYATRHLMIQTSAGVPLFDSIVSISENYNDQRLDYGAISTEFEKIVKEVRGGKELSDALEHSASRINSADYRWLVWQLANSNKAGANIGFVLRQMMSYLEEEQRVKIRDYGSQLSPLAIFYMLACVIAPTMGIIFLVIISALAGIAITGVLLGTVLAVSCAAQVVFIGLIKSKRPVVAI